MKKILVPTDFSQNAQTAFEYAVHLYDTTETIFVLLNAFYIPHTTHDGTFSYQDVSKNEAEEAFDNEIKRIERLFPDLRGKIETHFEIGAIVEIANQFAKENNIDLMVMGTKGATGLVEILVGSITSSMIKKVECPLVVVPEKTKVVSPKKILFTTDTELQSDDLNIDPLLEIAKSNDAMVHGLYVSKSPEDIDVHSTFIKYDLDMKLVDVKHDLDVDVDTNTVKAIERYVELHQPDLIAMVSTKGNLFHELFHQSVTKKIAMHTEVPMLIMHQKI